MISYSNNNNLTPPLAMDEEKLYDSFLSVSELNEHLKEIIEENYHFVKLKGEISTINKHSSGHLYLTVKDSHSLIQVVVFKNLVKESYNDLSIGDVIHIRGSVSLYVKSGKYSIQAYHISKGGDGDLFKEFLLIKQRLEKEGLFLESSKKKLPTIVKKLAIITSDTSAAIDDFLTIFRSHQALHTTIIIIPTIVQGISASKSIIDSLLKAQEIKDIDAILITRGGGAYEDLAPFNDEKLAYQVFQCPIAVLSAIGHEKDFTILDFVADYRFSTPSYAAQAITLHQANMKDSLKSLGDQLQNNILEYIELQKQKLTRYQPHLIIHLLNQHIKYKRNDLFNTYHLVQKGMKQALSQHEIQLAYLENHLQQQNPLKLFKKGFQFISKKNNPITSIKELKEGDHIDIQLIDGKVAASILPQSTKS